MIKRSCIIVAHCCCPGPFRAHTKWQDGAEPPPAQVLTFMTVCESCPHVLLSCPAVLLSSCIFESSVTAPVLPGSPYQCPARSPAGLFHTVPALWGDTPRMSSSSQTGQAQHLTVSALHPSHGRWEPITHPLASSGSHVPGTARAACTPDPATLPHHPLLHVGTLWCRGSGILAGVMLGGCQGTMAGCRGPSNSLLQHQNHSGSSPGGTLTLRSLAQGGCD